MNTQLRSVFTLPVITGLAAAVGIFVIALLVGGGGANGPGASPSIPPVANGSGSPTTASPSPASPSASPSSSDGGPSASPSAPAPSAKPSTTPATPATPAAWSARVNVLGLENCIAIVAAVDDRGNEHLAASCDGPGDGSAIRYAVSTDHRHWTTTKLAPPAKRFESDPQLAFVGDTLYLAYSRVAPTDGGCGDDGLEDVGVYYRTRTLPDGKWSEPKRLGLTADHLQSFRVSGSIVHATVTNETDGKTFVERLDGSTLTRYPIGDAAGWTSLRVGDDGVARIAYERGDGIGFAMVDGEGFASERIKASGGGFDANLALAPGNVAYVVWTRSEHGAGCAGGGPDPADGVYFATNASGSWVTKRLTTLVGGTSLTLDATSGDVHVLVSDYRRAVYFHRGAGGEWTNTTLARGGVSSPAIKQDPTTGALFVAYVADREGESMHVEVIRQR